MILQWNDFLLQNEFLHRLGWSSESEFWKMRKLFISMCAFALTTGWASEFMFTLFNITIPDSRDSTFPPLNPLWVFWPISICPFLFTEDIPVMNHFTSFIRCPFLFLSVSTPAPNNPKSHNQVMDLSDAFFFYVFFFWLCFFILGVVFSFHQYHDR